MAEGARLESVYRFIPIEGSNPSLTATNSEKTVFLQKFAVFLCPNVIARGGGRRVRTLHFLGPATNSKNPVNWPGFVLPFDQA